MELEIQRLVSRIKKKKPKALEKTMDLYLNSVYGVTKSILAIVASEEDIEECVQDVFLDVWNNIEKFDTSRGSFKTWILIICKYKALNMRKCLISKNKTMELEEMQLSVKGSIEDSYLIKERKEEILEVINSFDDINREVFIRRYLLEQSIEEICFVMNLTRQAVDNRLWRGRKQLRDFFDAAERGAINE